jgi:hypothetical protein
VRLIFGFVFEKIVFWGKLPNPHGKRVRTFGKDEVVPEHIHLLKS